MERRKFLIGMGSLAAGSAAAMGTSAFTSTSANRQLSVQVANDAAAYMGLSAVDGSPNSAYVSQDGSNGELAIEVADTSAGGSGVNLNSHTRIDDLFEVTNQGTQPVYVFVRLTGNGSKTNAYFYDSDNPKMALSPDYGKPGAYADQGDADSLGPNPKDIKRSAAKLEPGESMAVGLDVEALDTGTKFAAAGGLQVNAVAEKDAVPGQPYDP
ncbi:DUF1102 family protein [Halorhabdus sp. SVX81]|uniref:hypothetical protein n=1 Tax=Halorhabdus sp. SVX81 TaxID=2978283 RepID=UPI0023D982F9|nr:hypothetical protein [Halorhabdus sp. SVX81]WEL17528.1 DUF1102 family protein [Halorhabdus sp. SVX81]